MKNLIWWALLVVAIGLLAWLYDRGPDNWKSSSSITCHEICLDMVSESRLGGKVTRACWLDFCEAACTCAQQQHDYYPCENEGPAIVSCPVLQETPTPIPGEFFRKATRP